MCLLPLAIEIAILNLDYVDGVDFDGEENLWTSRIFLKFLLNLKIKQKYLKKSLKFLN